MMRTLLALGALALLLVACGDDDDSIVFDLGTDAFVPEPDLGPPEDSYLFGPCIIDSQCQATLGPSAFCRTGPEGFPEGQCTLPCSDRGPCDDGVIFNHCVAREGGPMLCEQACQNSTDCRGENYICAAKGQVDPGRPNFGLCVGICKNDEECGYQADCNAHAGECVPQGTVPTEGGRTGEPCADDDACLSGICILGSNMGSPTGWNGGSCIGNCALEPGWNSNDLYGGDAYPTGVCPDANVCYPTGELVVGSPGVCLKVCDSNADCRADEGYECSKTVELAGGPKTFTNGICFPVDCAETPCPAGFSCQMISTTGGTRSVCAPL